MSSSLLPCRTGVLGAGRSAGAPSSSSSSRWCKNAQQQPQQQHHQLSSRLPLGAARGRGGRRTVARAADNQTEQTDVSALDIDNEVEAFMKRQAEVESGAAFARTKDPERVIGADLVDDETAKSMARELYEILKLLKRTRDMSVNEIKLVVSIDDPRSKEARAIGIEDARGVSRDEMAAALVEVAEGRLPKDRIALKCLLEEITSWPFLDSTTAGKGSNMQAADAAAPAASSEPTKADYQALMKENDTIAKPYMLGSAAREGDKPGSLADMLPDWVGYATLYGVSIIPVLLGVGTILILFYNSLK